MIAFEITLNGKRICTAGVENFGVLTALLTWAKRRPDKSRDAKTIEEELSLEVSGLISDDPNAGEHLKWLSRPVRVGDTLLIRIADLQKVDLPATHYRESPESIAQAKRRYYEQLKNEYGE